MQFVDDYDSQFIGQTGIKYDHQATDVQGLLYQSGKFNHRMQAAEGETNDHMVNNAKLINSEITCKLLLCREIS